MNKYLITPFAAIFKYAKHLCIMMNSPNIFLYKVEEQKLFLVGNYKKKTKCYFVVTLIVLSTPPTHYYTASSSVYSSKRTLLTSIIVNAASSEMKNAVCTAQDDSNILCCINKYWKSFTHLTTDRLEVTNY